MGPIKQAIHYPWRLKSITTESTKLPNAPACKAAQSMLPTCKNREYDKTIERKWWIAYFRFWRELKERIALSPSKYCSWWKFRITNADVSQRIRVWKISCFIELNIILQQDSNIVGRIIKWAERGLTRELQQVHSRRRSHSKWDISLSLRRCSHVV